MTSTVYFARGADSGLWKIGYSMLASARALSLAQQYGETVTVVAVVAGGSREEYALHRRFAALRVEGRGVEWYCDDGSIASHVASIPAADLIELPALTDGTAARRLASLRALAGVSAKTLSTAAGLAGGHVALIESGRIASARGIEEKTLRRLSRALGVSVEHLRDGRGEAPSADVVRAAIAARLAPKRRRTSQAVAS
jgi:transcriptional regulator with XRE-family HTH domain